jgi:hypothetical protein
MGIVHLMLLYSPYPGAFRFNEEGLFCSKKKKKKKNVLNFIWRIKDLEIFLKLSSSIRLECRLK